jgi:hypothetical protein
MFHWSPTYGKLIKLVTFFLCSCHLAAKAYDLLNHFGLTMSQNWTLNAVDTIAADAMDKLQTDIHQYPLFIGSDNINIVFKVHEQTLQNQNKFVSGAATTVYILKSPDAQQIDPHAALF